MTIDPGLHTKQLSLEAVIVLTPRCIPSPWKCRVTATFQWGRFADIQLGKCQSIQVGLHHVF